MSADTFERHARTILGENESLVVDINDVAVAQIFRNSYGTPDTICIVENDTSGHHVGVIMDL